MTTQAITTSTDRFAAIDKIASDYLALNATGTSSFAAAIETATTMRSLRELLDDNTMKPVLELMNSPLGFLTDKDPKRPAWKNGRMEVPEPYAVAVVRDCVIEATLRGIPIIGNCFNIIGGRTYVTKEGFGVLLKKPVNGLTDLKFHPGIPKMVGENGALVEMRATWRKDGKEDSIERTIPVRVNSGMGTDAILGKAERKLKCAIFNQITGSELSDGDVDDAALAAAKPANVTSDKPTTVAAPPGTAASPKPGAVTGVAEKPAASSSSPAPVAKPAATSADPGPFDDAPKPEPKATKAEGVGNLIKATPNVSERGVVTYCIAQEQCPASAQVLEDLPDEVLVSLIANWANILEPLREASKPAAPVDEGLVAKVREIIAAEGISEEQLLDWCMGKRFCGPSTVAITALPETRLVWLINNIAKHKDAILAGPKAAKK